MAKIVRKRFGQIMVDSGLVTEEQVEHALKTKKPDQKIGDALIRLGYTTENKVQDALQEATGVKRVNLKQYTIEQEITSLVPEEYARNNVVIPLEFVDDKLAIAIADPLDYMTMDDLRLMIGKNLIVYVSSKADILNSIDKFYGFSRTLDALGISGKNAKSAFVIDETSIEKNPMVELVDQFLFNAVIDKASDIHIDPYPNKVEIKYRVDGMLSEEMTLPKNLYNQLVARIKVMAKMNVTETRIPQDGRIRTIIARKEVDLRISSMPTVNGEKVVMRILDLSQSTNDLSQLGFSNKDRETLLNMIHKPNGILLVSGPTGSGKSTTLYACLDKLDSNEDNIITIEDPVEMQIEGIHQVQVREEVDMTFANALRAILRQDPDTLMVGEIRDTETAVISVRAALTGHLVLSTIHTNDSISTIARLEDMGIEAFLVSAAVNGILAQRLVRKVCPDCSYWDKPTQSEKRLFESRGIEIDKIKRAVGCPSCNNKGYKSRTGIYEIFEITEKIRRLISDGVSISEIKEEANKNGMKYLIDDGLLKVKAGITTIEEILRVSVNVEV
ncbi:GspE/PulE family protein [Mycoplasmatota bacterium WC44]